MISWFRTYNAQVGKLEDLIKLTNQAIKHLKKAHGLDVDLYTQIGGDPTRIGLLGQYKDLGAVGKMEARIAKDAKWADIVKRAGGMIVEGSVHDELWKKN